MKAGSNAALRAPIDLLIAIGDKHAPALADALEQEADGDFDARALLLACLQGADRHTEIVNKRRRGGVQPPLYPFEVDPVWLTDGLPLPVKMQLIEKLRGGQISIREKKQTGVSGRRPIIFTKQVDTGVAVWERAIKWAVRVENFNAADLRAGRVSMPRRAWAAAIRISVTRYRLALAASKQFSVSKSDNKDFQIIEFHKALRAWRKLVRR